MSPCDWKRIYNALPSRLSKLQVRDRLALRTTCMDTRLESPQDLQSEIDTLVQQVKSGRAFVRPSGTQDVVRVYSEACTQADADLLALNVLQAVHRHAGGVGDIPTGLV
jgi:phosphoacetylglucosamine mutase